MTFNDVRYKDFYDDDDNQDADTIITFWLFVWYDSLRPSQQSFSYGGTCLPGLNQY